MGLAYLFLEGSGEAVLQTYREKVKMSVSFMEQSGKQHVTYAEKHYNGKKCNYEGRKNVQTDASAEAGIR